jgi:DNA uptake protein ComE-like DNA-binding protein
MFTLFGIIAITETADIISRTGFSNTPRQFCRRMKTLPESEVRMKKAIAFFVSVLCCIGCIGVAAFQTINANQPAVLTSTVTGRVVEVIDADALAVRLTDGRIMYVRLLGVDASTRHGGLRFMQDSVFGKNVSVVPDYTGSAPQMTGRYNYAYVFIGSNREMLNRTLIRYGFAEADTRYRGISNYNTLASSQSEARSIRAGIWGEGEHGVFLSNERINLNTASSRILEENMSQDTPDTVIMHIVNHRQRAPFKSVSELKFVPGMTRNLYNSNRHLFSVITNINRAGERELRSLFEGTRENVNKILQYRTRRQFSELTDLFREADVDREFYDRNRHYLAMNDTTVMTHSIPIFVVNVNTATYAQLNAISDVPSALATEIVNSRRTGYTLKTLGELDALHRLSVTELNALADNLNIYTDVNSATIHELESLYGAAQIQRDINNIEAARPINDINRLRNVLPEERFLRIQKHIYARDLEVPERININTANNDQLRSIGMTSSEASSILSRRGAIHTPSHIPFNISNYDTSVALYTNINMATVRELRSLNAFTENVIAAIISYREDQPFGSRAELEMFFTDQGYLSAYRSVRNFIVVR